MTKNTPLQILMQNLNAFNELLQGRGSKKKVSDEEPMLPSSVTKLTGASTDPKIVIGKVGYTDSKVGPSSKRVVDKDVKKRLEESRKAEEVAKFSGRPTHREEKLSFPPSIPMSPASAARARKIRKRKGLKG